MEKFVKNCKAISKDILLYNISLYKQQNINTKTIGEWPNEDLSKRKICKQRRSCSISF